MTKVQKTRDYSRLETNQIDDNDPDQEQQLPNNDDGSEDADS